MAKGDGELGPGGTVKGQGKLEQDSKRAPGVGRTETEAGKGELTSVKTAMGQKELKAARKETEDGELEPSGTGHEELELVTGPWEQEPAAGRREQPWCRQGTGSQTRYGLQHRGNSGNPQGPGGTPTCSRVECHSSGQATAAGIARGCQGRWPDGLQGLGLVDGRKAGMVDGRVAGLGYGDGSGIRRGLRNGGSNRNPHGLWLKGPEGLPHVLEKNVVVLRPSESLVEGIKVHPVRAGSMTGGFILSVRVS